ncbi:MAG: hypothetical protein WDZ64_00840 [Parcubacteria group bacterium]
MLTTEILSTIALPLALLVLISSTARLIHLKLFERYFKLTFVDAPVWSLLYFTFWSCVVFLFFPLEIQALFAQVSLIGYLFLAVVLLVLFPTIYKLLKANVGNPEWLAKLYPEQGILSFEEAYIFAKIGDVIFQQFVAGAMILTLVAQGVEYPQITGIFVILFMFAHLYIFREAGLIWGMHYTAYATLGAFAIPFFIIFVPAGVVYAIVLHMLFYVLSAVFFAILPYPTKAVRRHIGH